MNPSHQTAFQWMLDEQEGRLDAAERQALAQHLAACEQCARDAALMGWLASPAAEGTSVSRLSDRQIVKGIYTSLRRGLQREPFQGGAWAIVVFALLVLFIWAIDQLNPNVVFAATMLGSAPRPTVQAASEPWVLGSLIFFSGLIAPILTAFVGQVMARRRAFGGWLTFLVVILALAFGFFYYAVQRTMQGNALYSIVDLPFLVFVMAALLIHLWEFRAHWSGITLGLLGLFGIAILAFFIVPIWDGLDNTMGGRLSLLGVLLAFALLLALAWKAWEWRGGWRWLASFLLGLVFVAMVGSLLVISPYFLLRNTWLQVTLQLGSLFWPFVASLLAARLLLYLLRTPQTAGKWRLFVAGLAFALCFGSLYADIYQMALTNSTSEDAMMGAIMIWVACIAAMLALVAIGWKLAGWRVWLATVVMFVFLGGLIPATIIPEGVTAAITTQRAEQINQAVLRYQAENGHYPASLADLEPRYLLQVPAPITAFRQNWCYQAGADYYELGYYDAFHANYPGFIQVKTYASAGTLPSGLNPCQRALLDAIH